jgi:Uma2 family endonuclease
MAPSPTLEHQTILRQVFLLVHRFVADHQLGEVWFAPLDIVIQQEPLRTRQPDLLFVSNERAGILRDIVEGPPDLVVEILSPANTRTNLEEKLADYGGLGVNECWMISPEARSVEVLRLEGGKWTRISIYGLGDQVQSQVLSGLTFSVDGLFV